MNGPIEIRGFQQPIEVDIAPRKPEFRTPATEDSFSDMLSRAIGSVDQAMKTSEQGIQDFAAGRTENVHDVMINMQKAQLSFQLMVEIRNKAIEAYQEISRMQI
ncbi:flagellar hook-basal body complex protein FliE [Balneolaceae bacterium ANBcel3]|nr:flagellar hook-basal body complex protein FliE [Balneolaceae bacterium ANBcel3]